MSTKSPHQSDYFGTLVQKNFEELSQYYWLIQTQSRQSFRMVWIAGVAGLVFVLFGIILGLYRQDYSNVAYLSSAVGLVMQIISTVFFKLYGETQTQLRAYHRSMTQVQNLLVSYKLIEDTIDENRKNIMRESLMSKIVQPPSEA